VFEFDNEQQNNKKIDTAMGTREAPTMANIFMADIDKKK
jgi:hypothetical protein